MRDHESPKNMTGTVAGTVQKVAMHQVDETVLERMLHALYVLKHLYHHRQQQKGTEREREWHQLGSDTSRGSGTSRGRV